MTPCTLFLFGTALQSQTDASGLPGLLLSDCVASLLVSFPATVSEAHSAAENGGSSVNCQPQAVFFKSDTFGDYYLRFCLVE